MKIIRYLLFPISIIYGIINYIRNVLYDYGILKSYSFDIPVIAVGNLSVGGTGKSPQIEYLIKLFESQNKKVATLSRGYKRKTKGFILADQNTKVEDIGDEPYQIFKKFSKCLVAVCEDRKTGIEKLLKLPNKPDLILLDDAFQHRKVKAGFYILLTAYSDLFSNDFMLPTGNLREFTLGKKRANCVIVTKCKNLISEMEKEKISTKLGLNTNQQLFFTNISYGDYAINKTESIGIDKIKTQKKYLLAGIAKPFAFFNFLNSGHDSLLTFNDHHHFSQKELENFSTILKTNKIITTEKDYVRLEKCYHQNLLYLPIETNFLSDKEKFDSLLLNFFMQTIK